MRFLFLFMALAALFSAIPADAEQAVPIKRFVYEDRTGDDVIRKQLSVQEVPSGLYLIINEGAAVERKVKVAENNETLHEEYVSKVNDDYMTAERKGKVLMCEGSMGGKKVSEKIKMKTKVPWYGSIYLLKDFVLSGERKTTFYLGSPEDCRFIKLKAVRQGTETITVGGESVLAVKLRYTVPDIRGLFWKSYYWYRASDGVPLKTEEVRGPPGTPRSYTELISEEETVFDSAEIMGTSGFGNQEN
jgi:hypothetical protein